MWTRPQYSNTSTPLNKIHVEEQCGDPDEYVSLATKMLDLLAQMQKKLSKNQATSYNPQCGEKFPPGF